MSCCSSAIEFKKQGQASDCAESTANFLLKPFRLACGKVVTVKAGSADPFLDQEKIHPIWQACCFIFSLTLWLPFTIAGFLIVACSDTHSTSMNLYQSHLPTPSTTPRPKTQPHQPSYPSSGDPNFPYVWFKDGYLPQTLFRSRDFESIKPIGELHEDLNTLRHQWWTSPLDHTSSASDHDKAFDLRAREHSSTHFELLKYVKRLRPDTPNPLDSFWALFSPTWSLSKPLRIEGEDIGEPLLLEEGRAFELENLGREIDLTQSEIFCNAIKRIGNQLYLYCDGISQGMGAFVNERFYPSIETSRSTPACRLEEGDRIYRKGFQISYVCKVGPNGTLIFPPRTRQKPHGIEQDSPSVIQSNQFFREIHHYNADYEQGCPVSDLQQVGYIPPETPLEPGFAYYSSIIAKSRADQSCKHDQLDLFVQDEMENEMIYYHPEQDTTFQQIVEYLEAEFELMDYTEEQKFFRLTTFTATMLDNFAWGRRYQFGVNTNGQNFFLGEILKGGQGRCRHRALLLKALADNLGLQCGLFTGICRTNGRHHSTRWDDKHAWNIAIIDGQRWLVDPNQHRFFPITRGRIPGDTYEEKERVINYYGLGKLLTRRYIF